MSLESDACHMGFDKGRAPRKLRGVFCAVLVGVDMSSP